MSFEGLLQHVPVFDEAASDYVGSEACLACHKESHAVWAQSGHARAWAALTATNDHKDPECVGCHVVGWGVAGGFDPVALTPVDVQCETCHGPGGDHIRIMKPTPAGKLGERFCIKCHDLENSPKFEFETYWPKIAHSK